jgi:type II secretory pathway component PulM
MREYLKLSVGTVIATFRRWLMQALAWAHARIQPLVNRWRLMPRNTKLMVAGGAAVVLITLSLIGYRAVRGCSSRDAVMDRVALVTATLQDDAAHHRITITELADDLKRINEAAAQYNASQDSQAYCAALNNVLDDPSN